MSEFNVGVFAYNENGPGLYQIMVIEMEDPGRHLRNRGWRDGGLLYLALGTRVQMATAEWRDIERELTAEDDDCLKNILIDIDSGDVSVEDVDGCTFGPEGLLMEGDS